MFNRPTVQPELNIQISACPATIPATRPHATLRVSSLNRLVMYGVVGLAINGYRFPVGGETPVNGITRSAINRLGQPDCSTIGDGYGGNGRNTTAIMQVEDTVSTDDWANRVAIAPKPRYPQSQTKRYDAARDTDNPQHVLRTLTTNITTQTLIPRPGKRRGRPRMTWRGA